MRRYCLSLRWDPGVRLLGAALASTLGAAGCGELLPGAGGWETHDGEAALVSAEAAEARSIPVAAPSADEIAIVELGPSEPGDEWTFRARGAANGARQVVLALLDQDGYLLRRGRLTTTLSVRHRIHQRVASLRVALHSETDAGWAAELTAVVRRGLPAPQPQPQVVWLNFAGGQDVRIGEKAPVAFGPFDAGVIGPAYTDKSAELKAAITAVVRAAYDGFDVRVLSSDETAAPVGPYATVHFGGDDAGQLGLADGVDRYNADRNDQCIVYVEGFASYATMDLRVDELGRMIGNTAAHELGHLLGLYHMRGDGALMSDTHTAWELTEPMHLKAAEVAPSVFPVGIEDPTTILGLTVGWRD